MTDLPQGDPFNAICPDAQYHGNPFRYCPCGWMEDLPASYHAYYPGDNLDLCARYVIKLVIDRVREAGKNPRLGTVTLNFEDHGVGAKWESKR
jgi:hypothetical protein